jgi:hypothetical protein
LVSGVVSAAGPEAIGEDYLDADGHRYLPLPVQPVLVPAMPMPCSVDSVATPEPSLPGPGLTV